MFTPDERGGIVENEFIHLVALAWLKMLQVHNWWVGLFGFIDDPDVRKWVTLITGLLATAGVVVVAVLVLKYVCIGLAKVVAKTAKVFWELGLALYEELEKSCAKGYMRWRAWRLAKKRRPAPRATPTPKPWPNLRPGPAPAPTPISLPTPVVTPPATTPTTLVPPAVISPPAPAPSRPTGRSRVYGGTGTVGGVPASMLWRSALRPRPAASTDDAPPFTIEPPEPRLLGQMPSAERDAHCWRLIGECADALRNSGLRATSLGPGQGAAMLSRKDRLMEHVPFTDVVEGPGWSSQDLGGGAAPMEVRVTPTGWEVVSSYGQYAPGSTHATRLAWRISSADPEARSQVTLDPTTKDEDGVTVEEAYQFVAAWVMNLCQPRF